MGKKPINWKGFLLIAVYLLGLFLFGWGVYQAKTNPQSAAIKFLGGSSDASFFLSFFGGCLLIVGGIFVVLFYKKFAVKTALSMAPEVKAHVKVVSKTIGVNIKRVQRTGHSVATSNVFFVIFEFQDGRRKNFRVKDINIYNTILENDTGMLMYKESGKHTLFIDFQRQL